MNKFKEYNLSNFLLLFLKKKKIFFLLISLIIFFGGIRFSDINSLYQISLSNKIDNFFFPNQWLRYGVSGEFLYDSPLKILLIRIIPSDKSLISILFLTINLLPFIFLFKKNLFEKIFLIAIIIFSPIIKILFLNIGTGDGLLVYLILFAFFSKKNYQIAICFFVMGLWHPQQSFFIFFSYFISDYCLGRNFDKNKFIISLISIFISFLVYIYFKEYLIDGVVGRVDILSAGYSSVLVRNLYYLLFVLLPVVLWFCIFYPIKIKYELLFFSWIVLLVTISLLVLDSTRVLMITLLPMMCFTLKSNLSLPHVKINNFFIIIVVLLNIISPTISWSGYDWILFYDLNRDLCNHYQICL